MSRVKEFREKYGLTQKQVCDIIGMPHRTLENWEQGKNKPSEWVEDLVLKELYRQHFDQKEK